jgi:hypothetical protein
VHKPKIHARSRHFCVGLSQSQVTQQPLVPPLVILFQM